MLQNKLEVYFLTSVHKLQSSGSLVDKTCLVDDAGNVWWTVKEMHQNIYMRSKLHLLRFCGFEWYDARLVHC
jgi:hypothetical protein